ncbi:MAG TPA: phospholipase D-like domain-containing protein [Candidatus Bathyarchaeia archaeon]|nr:phospholipase D-like domain-containing protein [Candidatus Bathyarchaeia archaeon]
MRRSVLVAALAALLLWSAPADAQAPRVVEPEQSRPWAVYFSPDGGATQAVVEALGRATQSVLVQASAVSAPQIVKALADAQQRGVKVEALLERKHARGRSSAVEALARAGVLVLLDGAHPAVNTNVIVIDHEVVLTGGYTFTAAAERENVESLLVIHAPGLAARYAEAWQAHAAHSVRYASRP